MFSKSLTKAFLENFFNLSFPLFFKVSLYDLELISLSIAEDNASTFSNSKYKILSVPISLKIGISEHIIGRSLEKHSSTGIPNPSSDDGKTKNKAFEYNPITSESGK